MTVISSNEFAANQQKYFDLAINSDVYVKNGENMFMVCYANNGTKRYLEPDDDFHRAITIDEFRYMVKEDIHQIYSAGK